MWLETKPPEMMKFWLRATSLPMLATMPDGEILWCNESFEQLVGYSSTEICGNITWIDLTVQSIDAEHDQNMAMEVQSGMRHEYLFRKAYRHKGGEIVPVEIHVMRWPLQGDFQWFLVSVLPIEGQRAALKQMEIIQSQMVQLMEKPTSWEQLARAVQKYPKIAFFIGSVLATLLFGSRVIEIVQELAGTFGVGRR